MDDTKLSVKLTGPAKISGKIRQPGETVSVSEDEFDSLMAVNLIDGGSVSVNVGIMPTSLSSSGDDAFALTVQAAAKALAETMVDEAVQSAIEVSEFNTDELKTKLQAETANVATLTSQLESETARADAAEKALSETKLTDEQIAEIQEAARKASVENIGSIVDWLKVEDNAKTVAKLTDTKAAKVVSEVLGREISEPEYKTAATALALSK